jgi:hypothetical protein
MLISFHVLNHHLDARVLQLLMLFSDTTKISVQLVTGKFSRRLVQPNSRKSFHFQILLRQTSFTFLLKDPIELIMGNLKGIPMIKFAQFLK